MLSLTVHVRQDLGEWVLNATLVRDLGKGTEPEVSSTVWTGPLTDPEWDGDDLSAVLSALARWSGVTMSERSLTQ